MPSKQKYFMPTEYWQIKMEKHDRKYCGVEIVGFNFFLLFFSLDNNMSKRSVEISFVEKEDI